jgi:signal transduction histidine kinase
MPLLKQMLIEIPPARPRPGRYLLAIAAVTVCVGLRFLMQHYMDIQPPFLLFFAAIMLSGWYGGFRPGLVATLLCAIAGAIFFMDSLRPPTDIDTETWRALRLGLFLLEGVIASALCGQLHVARERAERIAKEAKELERTVEEISEAEQRRIGQDLHDGLGQHLTGVAFLSKALQQRLSADARPEARDAATINDLVNESIRWTRDLARGLAPMDLDRSGLPEALRDLASKTSRMFDVQCSYDGIDRIEFIDDHTALNLYRVAQEAVSNGVKHGKARNIAIDLTIDNGLDLIIRDDGIGFTYRPGGEHVRRDESGVPIGGMGLLVMRYRAGVIGGRLHIESRMGQGTLVRCSVLTSGRFRIPTPLPALSAPEISNALSPSVR